MTPSDIRIEWTQSGPKWECTVGPYQAVCRALGTVTVADPPSELVSADHTFGAVYQGTEQLFHTADGGGWWLGIPQTKTVLEYVLRMYSYRDVVVGLQGEINRMKETAK